MPDSRFSCLISLTETVWLYHYPISEIKTGEILQVHDLLGRVSSTVPTRVELNPERTVKRRLNLLMIGDEVRDRSH